jgi:3-dehydroquinate synthase
MAERRTSRNRKRAKPLVFDVRVPVEDQSYPVIVGRGIIDRLGAELHQRLPNARNVVVVSDSNVWPLYGDRARASLEQAGLTVIPIVIPAGEASKSSAVLFDVVDQMLSGGLGRRDAVVALGGGVVGDLGGLAAALFMRGVALVQCPTSLLAQVDASVGGKVAIDLPAGKNLLGTFHFPHFVMIDPEALKTLDDRNLGCGLAEMLKHGALFSADHFTQLVAAGEAIYRRDVDVITPLIATSVGLKAACVGRDPWETGEAGKGRVLLNLGHTIAHAIEASSNYALAHGEAVALGLRAAARVSTARGIAADGLEELVRAALEALRLPVDLDAWVAEPRRAQLERALAFDKKRSAGRLAYVALAKLGEPRVLMLSPRDVMACLRPDADTRSPGDG